ncbi:hypothetical protein [Streptomyces sp. NPDC052127]
MDRTATSPDVITPALARLVTELEHDDDRNGPEADSADVRGEVTTWAA